MLSTTSTIRLTRRVGLPDSVPKAATPAMLTAGPMGSVGAAFKSPKANWNLVSFTVRGDSVRVLLNAIERSALSRSAAAEGVFVPPAPRELGEVTSYWL